MRDVKDAIQTEADQIAEKRYMREFYDLPKSIQFQVWCEAESIVKDKLADQADALYDRMREEGLEFRVRDKKAVEVAYPSGRRVRYHYNHILSEMQPELPIPPKGLEE